MRKCLILLFLLGGVLTHGRLGHAASSPKSFKYSYTLKREQSLYDLSLLLYDSPFFWKKIAKWNQIKEPFTVEAGRTLQLRKKPLPPRPSSTQQVTEWNRFLSEGFQVRVQRRKQNRIPSIRFQRRVFQLKSKDQKSLRPFVVIKGKLLGAKSNLLINGKTIVEGGKNQGDIPFEATLPIQQRLTYAVLTLINFKGEITRERIRLKVENWKKVASGPNGSKTNRLSLGLGVTQLTYSQTDLESYSALLITPKVSYALRITEKFDFGVNLFYNAYTLSSNRSDGVEARFLGINARVGYRIPFGQSSWSLSLLGGIYYLTMMVDNREFGFRNIVGPQFFPVLRGGLGRNGSIYLYGKYSPVSTSIFGFRSLDSREIAGGAGYSHSINSLLSLVFSLDLSQLQIVIEGQKGQATTTSLSIGVGF